MEEWRDIPVEPWAGIYQVSNLGRVRYTPRILSQRLIKGYPIVSLYYQGTKRNVPVHRIVAAAFIRPPKDEEVVNHLNATRHDNRPENLEWTTPAMNNKHTAKLGRTRLGTDHPLGKINHKKAFQMLEDGYSYSAIARNFGATVQAVSQLIKRSKAAGRL